MAIGGIGAVGASLSGLDFQRARLSASSHNVANVVTEDFQPIRAVASAGPDGGVRTQIVELPGPPTVMHELVDQKAAVAAYQANVSVLKTADEMTQSLLDAVGA